MTTSPRARLRHGFLWLVGHTLNRVTVPLARAGRGPWSLVRHTGRVSGRPYETPVLLAPVPEGFVAELTYGPSVDWYHNIVAAGGCTVVHRGAAHRVGAIEGCGTREGLAAFGGVRERVLRLLRRREFRLLRTEPAAGRESRVPIIRAERP